MLVLILTSCAFWGVWVFDDSLNGIKLEDYYLRRRVVISLL